jgi:hypothetical protein
MVVGRLQGDDELQALHPATGLPGPALSTKSSCSVPHVPALDGHGDLAAEWTCDPNGFAVVIRHLPDVGQEPIFVRLDSDVSAKARPWRVAITPSGNRIVIGALDPPLGDRMLAGRGWSVVSTGMSALGKFHIVDADRRIVGAVAAHRPEASVWELAPSGASIWEDSGALTSEPEPRPSEPDKPPNPPSRNLARWDIELQRWESTPITYEGTCTAIGIGPNEEKIAIAENAPASASSGTGARVRVLTRSGEPIARLPQKTSAQAIAFDSAGRYLVTGDGNIAHVWDIDGPEAKEVARIPAGSSVLQVGFVPDNSRVIVVASDRADAYSWRTGDVIAEVCQRAGRDLTPQEWSALISPGDATPEPFLPICSSRHLLP